MRPTSHDHDKLPMFGQKAPRGVGPARRPAVRTTAVPLVGIVRNPRSHRNKTREPELAHVSNILTETPATREELRTTLEGFARRGIGYLVVDGGDGTVRDVLTCGAQVFGESWPDLIVLPKGKTNALAVDLGLPNHWSLKEGLAAASSGQTVERHPLRISPAGAPDKCVQGFLMGSGAFTQGTEAGQAAHRHGAFNSFAVGLTIVWGLIQAFFGGARNPWRRTLRTAIIDRRSGQRLPSAAPHDARYLMVATTFERFPLGARPFGANPASGLKMAVIDKPHRWLMVLFPAILAGFYSRRLERFGARRLRAGEVELDLEGAFIVDGEAFAPGRYHLGEGPALRFVVP